MKVRVFDLTPEPPVAGFEPQEPPLLGASEGSLTVELAPSGRVAYSDVVALAAFRSLERGGEQLFLLLFLRDRPRPLVVEASRIRFDEFSIPRQASVAENVRQVGIHVCRQAGSMLVDRSTLAFLKSGGAPPLHEGGMAALATSFGRVLRRSAPPASKPAPAPAQPPEGSPHQTRPIPRAAPILPQPVPAMPLVPAEPPAVAVFPTSFQPMEVQVFDPNLDFEELAHQPHDVFRIGDAGNGFLLSPEILGPTSFIDMRGVSVFRSLENGTDKTFLMWVMDGNPRPLLAEIQQIQFGEFPIQQSTTATETLRQLVLYICQRAGRMAMDRATGTFLQQGGLPPLLEKKILSLATALGRALSP